MREINEEMSQWRAETAQMGSNSLPVVYLLIEDLGVLLSLQHPAYDTLQQMPSGRNHLPIISFVQSWPMDMFLMIFSSVFNEKIV